MTSGDPLAAPLLDTLREVLAQNASIPALRMVVFLWALLGAVAWCFGRARLALALITIGGGFGVSYWLIQIRAPLGLGTDAEFTRQWAQAGVTAAGGGIGGGFVWGAEAEVSVPSMLVELGVPMGLVWAWPQWAVLLAVMSLALVPFLILGRTATSSTTCFTGALLLSGGLWPGHSWLDWLLTNPAGVLLALLGATVLAGSLRVGRIRAAFRHNRSGLVGILVAAFALSQSVLPLLIATVILAPRLRAAIRGRYSHAARARRLEGLVLLSAMASSGLLWWTPTETVPGFAASRDPGTSLRRPLDWLRQNVPPGEVVMASEEYSAAIAAIAGRRVLFWPPGIGSNDSLPEPSRRSRLYATTLRGQPVARLAESFSATHLFLGPGQPEPIPQDRPGEATEPRMQLIPVYSDVEDFRVFRLTKK